MKLSAETNQKISYAAGFLVVFGLIVVAAGDSSGFVAFADQINSFIVKVVAVISVYFLGSTATKNVLANKSEKDEKASKK